MATQPVVEERFPADVAKAPRPSATVLPFPAAFRPGLRSFDLHPRLYFLLVGSFVWFLAMMTIGFGSGEGMSIVLAICGVYLAMFFGLAVIFERIPTGDGKPRQTWADFMHEGCETNTGHTSGAAAAAQVLTLPLSIAFFATAAVLINLVV